jgi:hypothetical protein
MVNLANFGYVDFSLFKAFLLEFYKIFLEK